MLNTLIIYYLINLFNVFMCIAMWKKFRSGRLLSAHNLLIFTQL